MSATSTLSAKEPPFSFLSLPLELRRLIYADILTTKYLFNELPYRSPRFPSERLAILRASKAVYLEAKSILFEKSTFVLKIPFLEESFPKALNGCKFMQNIKIAAGFPSYYTVDGGLKQVAQAVTAFGTIPAQPVTFTLELRYNTGILDLNTFFRDPLHKLTRFKTVMLKFGDLSTLTLVDPKIWLSTYTELAERVLVSLGPCEVSNGFGDSGNPMYCLTFHPQRHASDIEANLV